ncbi:MAG TPA: acyl-CoA dehydrogenase family protein [Candidatus Binatia bacterium]|nr:acyl-CoA dehydrogenase family protein [Candidatus Binatia bacterium]
MRIAYTPEQRALAAELRAYFATLVTPAYQEEIARTEGGGPEYRRVLRRLGADGWLGVGWPREYGGQGRSAVEQFIFFDEAMYAGVMVPTLTINAVAPTLMQYGTEAQKRDLLPRILRGECHFAIGYTEPSAGTDLASLRTRAVRDGDGWVINGNKIFTSQAEYADYIWLAARTSPDAPKHKGLSIFMVPTSAPGYKCTPIWTMGGFRTNSTYYEDVRVPAEALVGPENEGWWLIVTQLNHERIALMTTGMLARLLEDVLAWARSTRLADGRRVIDQPWVQLNLARVRAKLEVLRLVNWKQAWSIANGALNYADASVVKVFGSELNVEGYRLLLEVLGPAAGVRGGSPDAVLRGRLEHLYRGHAPILTFGGGTNEVQRDIIAMAGLGMPREPRGAI